MVRSWPAVTVALLALSGSGCGTIANLISRDPEVYGGLEKDVEYAQTAEPQAGQSDKVVFILLAAEGTLTLLGDTLTLPIVLCRRARVEGRRDGIVPDDGSGDPFRHVQYNSATGSGEISPLDGPPPPGQPAPPAAGWETRAAGAPEKETAHPWAADGHPDSQADQRWKND